MALTNSHDPAAERGRLGVAIATIVLHVIAVSLLTFAQWADWRTDAALRAKFFRRRLAFFQQLERIPVCP